MANDRPVIDNPAKQTLKDGRAVVVFSIFGYTRPLVIKIAQQTGYDMLLISRIGDTSKYRKDIAKMAKIDR